MAVDEKNNTQTIRFGSKTVEIGGSPPEQVELVKSDVVAIKERIPMAGDDDYSYRKWFVLVAGFYGNMCNAFVFNMAVLNTSFLVEFGKSKAETALVQSTTAGMFLTAGVIVGSFVSRYGARKVGMAGGMLACLGTIASFFASSVPFLVVTLGIFTGTGLSACYIAAHTSVGEYFDGKSRLLALSLVSFGAGCGNILYPYFLDVLTREFGFRGCLLILGGLMMNIIPCFAVCKPQIVSALKSTFTDIDKKTISSKYHCTQTNCKWFTLKRHKLEKKSESTLQRYHSVQRRFQTLIQNKNFVLFTLAIVTAIPSCDSIIIFLINFLQMKGFDHSKAISIYFCQNLSNAMSRFLPGILDLIPHLSVLLIPSFLTSIAAISCGLLPTATSYVQHIVLLGCLGMARGAISTCMPVTTMKLVGKDLYSTGLGVCLTVVGISWMLSGPITGHLRDVSGSYDLVLYCASGSLCMATCLCVVAAIFRKYDRKRTPKDINLRNQMNSKTVNVDLLVTESD
ncbi:monocarboxylate transporter 12-like [Ylistrum balloti]|uniref:monocarboxylate transporter 12-like n=1 Tax=Ylistrum balloti TaxID=509963 RepID=UPI002905CF01|nr:monocarboxylate transporter 12-like [Ylistrum balloti]